MCERCEPWRRMLGAVALALACTIMAIWFDSFSRGYEVDLRAGDGAQIFASARGSVRWVKVSPLPETWNNLKPIEFHSQTIAKTHETSHDSYWRVFKSDWRLSFCEFDFGSGSVTQSDVVYRAERWAIPHWALAAPLSILSAYLLLSRPRQKPEAPLKDALQ